LIDGNGQGLELGMVGLRPGQLGPLEESQLDLVRRQLRREVLVILQGDDLVFEAGLLLDEVFQRVPRRLFFLGVYVHRQRRIDPDAQLFKPGGFLRGGVAVCSRKQ
jgi:hypothetical protein